MVKIRKPKQQVVEFDVHRFQQGGRTAYSLMMNLGTLDDNVPSFVNPERIEKANRRFNKAHSRRIADYMYDIDDWVLGAILLGISPEYVEFLPYEDEDGGESESLGFIRIPLHGGKSSMRILDGQHRRMAIESVRERLRDEIQALKNLSQYNGKDGQISKLQQKFARMDAMSIPVVLYEEADTSNLRRMFADLAQTRPIDATTKTRFDDRDPFNRAAVELVELGKSSFLADKVEMERTTPARASNFILAVNQLARCLKVLKYGYGGRASRDRIREAELNYDELVDLGIAWVDDFLPSARPEYEELCSIELEEDFVSKNRLRYISFSVTALQLMASCYYESKRRGFPVELLAHWLRQADFDLESGECIFLKAGMYIRGESSLASRRKNMKDGIEFIVTQAMEANL